MSGIAENPDNEGITSELFIAAATGSIEAFRLGRDRSIQLGSNETDRTVAISMFTTAEVFAWLAAHHADANATDCEFLGMLLFKRACQMSPTIEARQYEAAQCVFWLNAAADAGSAEAGTYLANRVADEFGPEVLVLASQLARPEIH